MTRSTCVPLCQESLGPGLVAVPAVRAVAVPLAVVAVAVVPGVVDVAIPAVPVLAVIAAVAVVVAVAVPFAAAVPVAAVVAVPVLVSARGLWSSEDPNGHCRQDAPEEYPVPSHRFVSPLLLSPAGRFQPPRRASARVSIETRRSMRRFPDLSGQGSGFRVQ